MSFSREENNRKGVAVLLKIVLKIDFGNVNVDPAGRYFFAEVKINYKTFVIGNIYDPSKDEPTFFELQLLLVLSVKYNTKIV